MSVSIETPARVRKARQKDATAVRKSGERSKVTLILDGGVDFRLTVIAAALKCDRSELANRLIDQGLQRYGLDNLLRSHTTGDTVPIDETVAAA